MSDRSSTLEQPVADDTRKAAARYDSHYIVIPRELDGQPTILALDFNPSRTAESTVYEYKGWLGRGSRWDMFLYEVGPARRVKLRGRVRDGVELSLGSPVLRARAHGAGHSFRIDITEAGPHLGDQ